MYRSAATTVNVHTETVYEISIMVPWKRQNVSPSTHFPSRRNARASKIDNTTNNKSAIVKLTRKMLTTVRMRLYLTTLAMMTKFPIDPDRNTMI